jgi:hypothetical protein
MNRLQKFIERSISDQRPGRTAYAFEHIALPPPDTGMNWQQVQSFSAADDLLADPSLKDSIRLALAKGYAVVGKTPA